MPSCPKPTLWIRDLWVELLLVTGFPNVEVLGMVWPMVWVFWVSGLLPLVRLLLGVDVH